MSIFLLLLLALAIIALVIGAVYSVSNRQKQTTAEDTNVPHGMARHPILLNPVLWMFIVFIAIVCITGAYYFSVFS